MEEPEGALSFDFEAFDAGLAVVCSSGLQPESGAATGIAGGYSATGHLYSEQGSRRSYRQTVCRHWLRSLCMKGDACGFLHEYDKSRMPVCRFFRMFGECREPDCVYKHTVDDMKECNMYKLGFCPNGPDCRYRHVKLPGPPPPVEEVLQKIQHLVPFNYAGGNRFFQNRNASFQQSERPQIQQVPNVTNQNIIGRSSTQEIPNVQQQIQQSQQQNSQTQVQNVFNTQPSLPNRTPTSLPQGVSRYFIVKSCNRENLELSAQQGVWATQRSNEAKLNEALDSADNVILIFSINRTRHFQGCAKMTSKIGGFVGGGNWKYAHGTAHYGRNFTVKWLKLCELSFHKTRYLRNPYNENLPVKISRDCQELEPAIGEQLASLLYLEPDSELMAVSLAAESKREEERAKGMNMENEDGNPDIVPFEDNEEDEEEESEDEEGSAFYGRGRGRGMMWAPHMPMPRGFHPYPGMRAFPPVMMGADGFPYPSDGFGMPDIFGMGPRSFPPYGPRFPGDFGMFGRPGYPGGGFGMMGPGRMPFPTRPGRPVGLPMGPQIRGPRRDQRVAGNERNELLNPGSDPSRGSDDEAQFQQGPSKSQQGEQFDSLHEEDSVSEDEAPRRSRHGEGKKRIRSNGDA